MRIVRGCIHLLGVGSIETFTGGNNVDAPNAVAETVTRFEIKCSLASFRTWDVIVAALPWGSG
jgi:hypothetical protein